MAAARAFLSRLVRCFRSRDCMRCCALVVGILLCVQLLGACTTPTRAPVVSRDQPPRPAKNRPTPQQVKNRPKYHRVRYGDTLYSIAWRYGLDFRVLAHWNGIVKPYTIYAGQGLRLSRQPAPPPRAARTQAPKQRPAAARKPVAPANKTAPKSSATAARKRPNKAASRTSTAAQRSKLDWRWPSKGRVAQRFSARDAVRKGIKISGRLGQPVSASEGGKVVYAGSGLIGYGRLVIIKHNKNYLSAYAHNRKLLVKEGQEVARGESIAEMGSDGNWPMLHFEIRRNGAPVDPLKLLPRQR